MRYLREVALAAIITSAATGADAGNSCSNATIKGGYAVSVQGESLGILQGTTVIPFPSPTLVNAVALIVFDGNGGLTQVDAGIRGGISLVAPDTPVTDNGFRKDETGTYSVAADCTGTAVINFPDGSEIDEWLVVGADGNIIKTVTSRQHVPEIPGNPNCTNGCDLATQVGTEEVRVSRGE
jgi:hypothetical protein